MYANKEKKYTARSKTEISRIIMADQLLFWCCKMKSSYGMQSKTNLQKNYNDRQNALQLQVVLVDMYAH